jgi:hypothetical protein
LHTCADVLNSLRGQLNLDGGSTASVRIFASSPVCEHVLYAFCGCQGLLAFVCTASAAYSLHVVALSMYSRSIHCDDGRGARVCMRVVFVCVCPSRSAQVLISREHLLIMGIRNFPYGMLDSTRPPSRHVSRRHVRLMAGNGMHSAAIGSMLLFALAGCEFS